MKKHNDEYTAPEYQEVMGRFENDDYYKTLLCGRAINIAVDDETGEEQEQIPARMDFAYIDADQRYLM